MAANVSGENSLVRVSSRLLFVLLEAEQACAMRESKERERKRLSTPAAFFFSLFDRAIVALKRRPFSLVFVAPPLAAEPCLLPR